MPPRDHEPARPMAPYVAGAILLGAVGLVLALSFFGEPRINDSAGRCAAQARGLTQALVLYAIDHGEQLPPPDAWQQLLVEAGYVTEECFDSPDHRDTKTDNYRYLAVSAIDWSPDHILLYHRTDLHDGGVHFGYHDGSVRLVPMEDAQRIIDALGGSAGAPCRGVGGAPMVPPPL